MVTSIPKPGYDIQEKIMVQYLINMDIKFLTKTLANYLTLLKYYID